MGVLPLQKLNHPLPGAGKFSGAKGRIIGTPMESFLSCPNRKLGGKMAYLRNLELLLAACAPSEEMTEVVNVMYCQAGDTPTIRVNTERHINTEFITADHI